jgi:hypothetical protein
VLAVLMYGAGVAEVLHPEGAHGFEDFGEQGGGRVCVQVDSAHEFILACWLYGRLKDLTRIFTDDTDLEQATANEGVLPLQLAQLARGQNDKQKKKGDAEASPFLDEA